MFVKSTLGLAFGIAFLLAFGAGAMAAFDPYSSGTTGYDVSYPQCGAAAAQGQFGIVGVNGGYPFTYYNNCLASEFADAVRTGNAALYINTGYDPTYTALDGRHMTQDCATKSQSISGRPDQQAAWGVGCSEAERDVAYAASQSASTPSAWWLDIETSNSWSASDLSLNQYTIEGIIATLRAQASVPIGVYSSSSQWDAVVGVGYHATVDADWVATGLRTAKRARAWCGRTGFTGAPVWLVQYVTSIDNDYVC